MTTQAERDRDWARLCVGSALETLGIPHNEVDIEKLLDIAPELIPLEKNELKHTLREYMKANSHLPANVGFVRDRYKTVTYRGVDGVFLLVQRSGSKYHLLSREEY